MGLHLVLPLEAVLLDATKDHIQWHSEPPRVYRRLIYLSQAAMPDRIKLS